MPRKCHCSIERHLLALRGFLERDGLLFAHSTDDGHHQILAVVEGGADLLANLTIRDLDIILGGTVVAHQIQEAIVDVDQLVFVALHVGDIHVVGRRRDVFVFLLSKDVDSDEMHLGVTVLAGLGGRHVDDL